MWVRIIRSSEDHQLSFVGRAEEHVLTMSFSPRPQGRIQ